MLNWTGRVADGGPTSGNRIQHHATQAEDPSDDCKKISTIISLPIFVHQIPQIVTPLIIMCGAKLSERSIKQRVTSKLN